MAEKTNPLSNQQPDPAASYERAKPEKESVGGRLDNPATDQKTEPDRMPDAISNRRHPATEEKVDHSMWEEEPLGEDLTPTDIHNPRRKRHPRTQGKGGTP